MNRRQTDISKFLSFALRHEPASIGIELDANGWVPIAELLEAARAHGRSISRDELDVVVEQNSKRRFAISDDGQRIRASQGHSVDVDLGYEPAVPPATLYHGTATRFVDAIRSRGILRGSRHHVHLSVDAETARAVGSRHGSPVVLVVRAGAMAAAGMTFFVSANGVWLTEHVPPEYIGPDESTRDG
jgi:putative RNA 2'-phosphotransferase